MAAVALLAVGTVPAAAWELHRGEKLSATLDSTFSTGFAIRVEERDDELIFRGNDPTDPTAGSTPGFFTNADDGNLNYDKGHVYSAAAKGTFELELDYRAGWRYLPRVGGFVRASGFYDVIANDPYRPQRTDVAKAARYRSSVTDGGVVGAQWTFLDMYVDGRFEVINRAPILRIGNQVLNWGEAIFTPGGISSTNAFDVAKLRIPGSELREAFVPAPIIRVTGDLVEDLGLEAYYQVYWNRTHVDPTGSYWATSDLVGRAAEGLFFGNDPGGTGLPADELIAQGEGIPRLVDDKPSNQGQFGVALRYYWDRILTEFGGYYIRYHSKTPTVGNEAFVTFPTAYFRDYADKIDVVGASFATGILNATLAGEIAYRWDDATPIVATGNALAAATRAAQAGDPRTVRVRGYARDERIQAAINLLQTFGPSTRWGVGRLVEFLAADSFSLVSEMALVNYPDLNRQCSTPFQPFLDVIAGTSTDCVPYAGVGPPDSDDLVANQFPVKSDVNATSLGYQLFLRGEYTNPFNVPITVNPTVGWRHDFHGTTPNQTFIENRKSVSLGLVVDYLQTWEASITYALFFGGGRNNLVHDRDFVSLSLAYRY